MAYEDYVEEITIESIEDLFDYITGRKNIPDLRDNFIFRGIKSLDYKLIPSSLREDNKNKIDEYVDYILNNTPLFSGSIEPSKKLPIATKEKLLLIEFLNRGDVQGFKIPCSQLLRDQFTHMKFDFWPDDGVWPCYEVLDSISFAQHYGIPTCALDWSYNYKVALYFSVIDVLKDTSEIKDGVLWAFNYKKLDENRESIKKYIGSMQTWVEINLPVLFYRPAYSDNPNLCAQEGLLTFIIQKNDDYSDKPLDQFVSDELDNCLFKNECGVKTFKKSVNPMVTLEKDEKLFYKFIIPRDLKAEILNDLYKEGYTEERIFPGYDSIVKSIENKVKLDKLLGGKKRVMVKKGDILIIFF